MRAAKGQWAAPQVSPGARFPLPQERTLLSYKLETGSFSCLLFPKALESSQCRKCGPLKLLFFFYVVINLMSTKKWSVNNNNHKYKELYQVKTKRVRSLIVVQKEGFLFLLLNQ